MNKYFIMLATILSFIFGCSSNPYHKKNGKWYYDDKLMEVKNPGRLQALNKRFAKAGDEAFYRGQQIAGCDGNSFEAFNENYAKDQTRVYYCDTYRKGQDYYFFKYNSIVEIKEADAPSFKYLGSEYAKDKAWVYTGGKPHPVKDVNTFDYLDYLFARDKITGYYQLEPVAGSDGESFVALDHQYAKDKKNVYFCTSKLTETNPEQKAVCIIIKGARPESFKVLSDNYAIDTARAYYENNPITPTVENFKMIGYNYARNDREVFYKGQLVAGADAASFVTPEVPTDSSDAKDNRHSYKEGIQKK